jgi:adenine-specific DNA methylase
MLLRVLGPNTAQNDLKYTGCIKKNATFGISQEIDNVGQKILGAWEFKIAQLSKLLHTRVHKAKFMHLFNSRTTAI